MARSKGSGRATIPHASKHLASFLRGGPRYPQFSPGFQVEDQKVPTASDPIRQHKKFAGG
jgi:hypothetical protein